jgi:hypothetical protein
VPAHDAQPSDSFAAPQFPRSILALWQAQPLRQAVPANLAFLAMTQHQLGPKELAQATLARLRKTVQQPEWIKDDDAQSFLREPELLLGGKHQTAK